MMAINTTVVNYLKSKHITVPEEWITACLEWIQTDNPGIQMGNSKLILDKVYEQWLHADLTELASCCLPFGLAQKKTINIKGPFVLQVNQVRDVGHPAYMQLQKLRKVDNKNAEMNTEKQYQPSWEAKPTRMLMMQMTDGTSMVQGMEYRTIPHLNVNMKPGTKVLVSGVIESRRGVLLLTREHITILGGETESLKISNALENILARTLGVEETEEPSMMEEIVATQITPSQASQYYPSQVNSASSRSRVTSQSSTVHRGGGRGGPLTTANRQQNRTVNPPIVVDDLGDDDFLDSDLEAALNQIETQAESSMAHNSNSSGYSSRPGSSQLHTNSNKSSFSSVRTGNKNTSWQTQESEMNIDDEFFGDDFDDEMLLSVENSLSQGPKQTGSSVRQVQNVTPSSSSADTRPNTNLSKQTKQSAVFSSQTHNSSFKHPSVLSKQTPSCSFKQSSSLSNQALNSSARFSTPVRAVAPQKISKPSALSLSSKNSKVQAKQSRLTNFLTKAGDQKDAIAGPSSVSCTNEMENDFSVSFDMDISINDDIFSDEREKKRRKITESNTVTERVKQEPFVYLFFLPERPTITEEYIVKGFIMTLVSKLEISDGNWKLTAVINDGSASCEVDIDCKILHKLIGMTAEEFQERKRESRMNPTDVALRLQLSKCVSGCQRELISLCGLLKLSVSPNNPRPRLIEIIPVSSSTASQLSQRSSDL